nr:MgtC/SapB family protein [Mediterraneibacter glycyrrhizinilyticus]
MINVMDNIYNVLKELNIISVLFRVLLAVFCGGVIGVERGRAHQPAGMRTYMLVCLGSALVMATGQYMYIAYENGDPSRLGAQVISGIGFLGAGSIISGKTKVRGLTTAAGLWTAASIGLAIGTGFYSAGIITTVIVCLIMKFFKKMEYDMLNETVCYGLYIEAEGNNAIGSAVQKLTENGMDILEVQTGKKRRVHRLTISLKNTPNMKREEILKLVEKIEGIKFVKYIY